MTGTSGRVMVIFGWVYRIENTVNGKSYIGQTTRSPWVRFDQHKRIKVSHCRALVSALKRHGTEAFRFEVLCASADKASLNAAEVALIAVYETTAPAGYNIRAGGSAGKHSEETRRKMSASHTGMVFSDSHRENMRRHMLGKSPSPATREKIAGALRGRPIAPASLAKLIASNIGRVPSEESRRKMSANRSGIRVSDAHKEKLRLANIGKRHSAETKKKMTDAQRARWDRRKQEASRGS